MRTEEECKQQHRFLFTDEIFSSKSVEIWKKECIDRVTSRKLEKTRAYDRFISWEKKDNEIALFTLYAYADFKIPKLFNCIFELNNPNNRVFTNFYLTQSIYECWYPTENIEDGYKHLCIFSFEDKIPPIINMLHVGNEKRSNIPKGTIKLGLCHQNNFEEIKKRKLYERNLKERYGKDWWKFDKGESE